MKKDTDGNPQDTSRARAEAGGEEAALAASPSEEAAVAGPGEEKGLRWLKYAGIGSRRSAKPAGPTGGLSGEAITSLGSLEAEVMAAVWDIGRPATGMEVMEHSLYKRRAEGLEPAGFATIATTLRRLTQKGLLASEKNAQRTPVYAATVGREEMAARVLNNVSETLLGRSLYALLPRLTGSHPAPDAPAAKQKRQGTSAAPPAASPDDAAIDHLLHALEELAAAEGQEKPEDA